MRILSVVLSFVLAVSLAVAGLTYLAHRIGEQRIAVQDSWISSGEEKGYRAYGEVAGFELDSIAIDAADRDTLAAR